MKNLSASVFFERVRKLFSAQWVIPTITLLMFVLAVSAMYHMLREISPTQLLEGMRAIPLSSLALSVLFMALSFLFMVGYDASALFYLKKRLPWRTVALGAFTGYAFSNTVGMALVSGRRSAIEFMSRPGWMAWTLPKSPPFAL